MILYFSGTGNSQYVAEMISMASGDSILSINDRIKSHTSQEIECERRPLIICCPIYAWRIPRVVETFLFNTSFRGSKEVYFVLTCGGETGNAIKYVRKLCDKKEWTLLGSSELIFPDNYIMMFKDQPKEICRDIVQNALPKLTWLTNELAENRYPMMYKKTDILGILESKFINGLFYKLFVSGKGFNVNESCIGCEKCRNNCPLNTIRMENSRPTWGKKCTQCMRCIGICPTGAINYRHNTNNKTKYFFDPSFVE